jgi:hypothetical protein
MIDPRTEQKSSGSVGRSRGMDRPETSTRAPRRRPAPPRSSIHIPHHHHRPTTTFTNPRERPRQHLLSFLPVKNTPRAERDPTHPTTEAGLYAKLTTPQPDPSRLFQAEDRVSCRQWRPRQPRRSSRPTAAASRRRATPRSATRACSRATTSTRYSTGSSVSGSSRPSD